MVIVSQLNAEGKVGYKQLWLYSCFYLTRIEILLLILTAIPNKKNALLPYCLILCANSLRRQTFARLAKRFTKASFTKAVMLVSQLRV